MWDLDLFTPALYPLQELQEVQEQQALPPPQVQDQQVLEPQGQLAPLVQQEALELLGVLEQQGQHSPLEVNLMEPRLLDYLILLPPSNNSQSFVFLDR